MILITGTEIPVDISSWTQLAKGIYEQKKSSPVYYNYFSTHHLQFEMTLRTKIVEASMALNQSGARFSTFKNARCNERFWNLTESGGFRLKDGVTPASGIRDIFVNGSLYSFECATAMVIVLYKGVLDSIEETRYNKLFANLLLFDWHYDRDLRLIQEQGSDRSYPGDILYFNNPDVSPETPHWQGENAVKLGNDIYYGHGIGIASARGIIRTLNRFRRAGAARSAYLTDEIVYPDFLFLSRFAYGAQRMDELELQRFKSRTRYIHVQIGGQRFIR